MKNTFIIIALALATGCETSYENRKDSEDSAHQKWRIEHEKAQQSIISNLYPTPENKTAARKMRVDEYLKKHPDTSPELKEKFERGAIAVGMTIEQVKVSWGNPWSTTQSDGIGGKIDILNYSDGKYYLFFTNGKLTRWVKN